MCVHRPIHRPEPHFAKNTLVSGAQRDGRTLIAVSMRAEMGQVCYDHTVMFDYGFANFTNVDVPGGKVTIPNGVDVSQLNVTETVDGNVTTREYYYNTDYYMGSGREEIIEEITSEPTPETVIYEEEDQQQVNQEKQEKQQAKEQYQETYRYIIYILVVLVGMSFLCAIIAGVKRNKKKKRRKKK